MILDDIRQLSAYEGVGFDSKKVLGFIEKAQRENLAEGRYELDGTDLFAMLQVYETKEREECLYETHKLYGDIQYIVEGKETIYASDRAMLEIEEDCTPEKDIVFYTGKEEAVLCLQPGRFAVFLPQDGHMPCCKCGNKQMVKKIVFKFRIKP